MSPQVIKPKANSRPSHAGRLGRLEPPHFFSFFFFYNFLEVLSGKEKETKRHHGSLTIQRVSLNKGSMIAFDVLCRSAVARP